MLVNGDLMYETDVVGIESLRTSSTWLKPMLMEGMYLLMVPSLLGSTVNAASTLQYIDYLPIYPSKKNQHSGIQLNLCNGWDAWTYLEKKFYVKMDEVYEIPVESLMAAGANGRQYELPSKSQDKVQGFLRKMNVRAIRDGASSTLCQLPEELVEVQGPASKSSSTMLRISRSNALENASGTSPSRSATSPVIVRASEPRASRSRPHIRALVSMTSKKPISLWYYLSDV